jgi:hypothetical protein
MEAKMENARRKDADDLTPATLAEQESRRRYVLDLAESMERGAKALRGDIEEIASRPPEIQAKAWSKEVVESIFTDVLGSVLAVQLPAILNLGETPVESLEILDRILAGAKTHSLKLLAKALAGALKEDRNG